MKPTKQQQAAIDSDHPRILCVAGPGSGKTCTAAERVMRLIRNGCDPDEIAVVTYTNEAAREFEAKLGNAVTIEADGSEGRNILAPGYIGTLHGFCLKHLQRFGPHKNPVVLDDEEADERLQRSARDLAIKGKLRQCRDNWCNERSLNATPVRIAVGTYYRALDEEGAYDYDSLLWKTRDMMQDAHLPQRVWQHLIVDEFHDASAMDASIYMAALACNKFVLADPDQAIFGFRGGSSNEILRLAKDPNWETHLLEQNFRSCKAVCSAAQSLIQHGRQRVSKAIVSFGNTQGGVHSQTLQNAATEALAVAYYFTMKQGEGVDMNECAVLGRTNAVVDYIRETLKAQGVPVRESEAIERPSDWRKARKMVRTITQSRGKMLYVWNEVDWRKQQLGNPTLTTDKVTHTVTITGDADKLEAELRALLVSEESIAQVLALFATLPDSADLNDLALAMALKQPPKEIGDGVTCTTVHNAKGREWRFVVFAGFEDEIIPGDRKSVDVEEERRVAYVGFMRAKEELTLTRAAKRAKPWHNAALYDTTPSRFLKEAGL